MSSFAATQFLPAVATGSAAKDFFIVSIHDVAPSTQEIAKKIIADLAYRRVRVCSLLIVPDYHHEGSFSEDRQFISWLRDLEADGHEMVIHGYFHERPRRNQETLRDRFITEFYTQQEGEFYDLDYDEALRRILKARNEFHDVGLSPRGFVAPAWLLNAESERAARDADMEYTTRLRTLHDLRSGEIFSARSLVYSVRNRWRRGTSLMWNAALAQLLKTNQLLRLSIHPPDYLYPRIWRQIGDLISGMDAQRTLTTYKDWITEQRTRASNESLR